MESGFYLRKGDKNMSDMCTDNHMTSYSSFDETELQFNKVEKFIREKVRDGYTVLITDKDGKQVTLDENCRISFML